MLQNLPLRIASFYLSTDKSLEIFNLSLEFNNQARGLWQLDALSESSFRF